MSKQFKSIKVGALSKESAIRMANRLNELHFKNQYAGCHGTEVMKGQYVTTLFVDDCQEVKDAHVSAVRTWDKVLRQRKEREATHEH